MQITWHGFSCFRITETLNGHEVSVVTFWNEQLPEFEEDEGVRVYRIRGSMHRVGRLLFTDQQRSYAPPFPDPEAMLALRRIIVVAQPW